MEFAESRSMTYRSLADDLDAATRESNVLPQHVLLEQLVLADCSLACIVWRMMDRWLDVTFACLICRQFYGMPPWVALLLGC